MSNQNYTRLWFDDNLRIWNDFIPKLKPSKILEIGSFEGRSACYLIEKCSAWHNVEIHCVDTWEGGVEHQADNFSMPDAERRFIDNTARAMKNAQNQVTLTRHKELSYKALAKMIAEDRMEYFDLIYIDGSHQAPDVITDAVMAFPLLRVGGVIVFDDYDWFMEKEGRQDLINMPKFSIDAFTNIFQRKIRLLKYPLNQIYAVKMKS